MYCTHCETQLEPGFKMCPGCGNPIVADGPSVPPTARRFSRRFLVTASCTAVAVIALAVILTKLLATSSYGPSAAANLEITAAPDISVEILPSAKSLAKARFDTFDVSPSGAIVVLMEAKLVDMASGQDLFTSPNPVQSFAFVGDALAAIDADGNLAAFEDGGLHVIGKPPVDHARLAPSSDHTRLFFHRNENGWLPESPALASMENSSITVLTGSISAIEAAGGDAYQTIFSAKNALFQIMTPGRPSLILALPDPTQTILGVAIAGTATYFSTDRAVYAFEDGIIVPLVLGLGGELRVSDGAVYVLDARQRRIYRIAVENRRAS